MTLMRTTYPQGCDHDFAQSTICSLAKIIAKMHRRGVMHRRIDKDIIGMRIGT